MSVEKLNSCLRSELSAVETYRQAIDKHRAQYGHEANFRQLTDMLKDHEQAVARLRTLVEARGGTPSADSGAWGAWSKTVMGTAKLLGDKAALKALKEGEESGVKQYRALIQDPGADADLRTVVNGIMQTETDHVRRLDALIDAA